MLNIQKNIEEGRACLSLEGRLDTVTAAEFEDELKGTLPDASELVLDLGGLEYVSSAGLRVLLAAQKVMMKKGGMKVINVNEMVGEVFEVTGFSDILNIE